MAKTSCEIESDQLLSPLDLLIGWSWHKSVAFSFWRSVTFTVNFLGNIFRSPACPSIRPLSWWLTRHQSDERNSKCWNLCTCHFEPVHTGVDTLQKVFTQLASNIKVIAGKFACKSAFSSFVEPNKWFPYFSHKTISVRSPTQVATNLGFTERHSSRKEQEWKWTKVTDERGKQSLLKAALQLLYFLFVDPWGVCTWSCWISDSSLKYWRHITFTNVDLV